MPIDYKEYHSKWKLIVRLIKKRANHCCEGSPAYPDCRAANYQPHPITGTKVTLTTAHMDHDKTNNRFWNLKSLCNRCHLNHDLQHHIFNRKYGSKTKYLNGKLFNQ